MKPFEHIFALSISSEVPSTEFMTEQFDNVIIGSGAGGLSAAICLSREGQSVLVLEQHYVPGGWCHSFTLNGQRFSPGVHYLGQLGAGESTSKMFRGIGLSEELKFFRMKNTAFEHCIIGNKRFDYPSDPAEFKTNLIEKFPHERKGIERYLNVVWKTQDALNNLISKRTKLAKTFAIISSYALLRNGYLGLERVVSRYIKDPDLRAILNIQCGNYGLSPENASFVFHCGVIGHYNRGGYFPIGGGGALVKTMTNIVKKQGGQVRTKTSVRRILIENKTAVGVELMDGQIIRANRIISNADPHITFTQLMDKNTLSAKLQKKLGKTKYSCSSLILFVTLAMDVRKAGIDSGNYWIAANNDLNNLMKYKGLDDVTDGDKFTEIFISCSSLKDPASQDGVHYNFEMITFIDNQIFTDLGENLSSEDPAYARFKEKTANKFLNHLEELIPGAKAHVVQMEMGTPKTNKFYINATQGNVYGTAKANSQIGARAFKARTEIENLFMCGASTLSHGVVGATYSGIVTSAEILQCDPWELVKDTGSDFEIFEAEESSKWPKWLLDKRAVREKRAKAIHRGEFLAHVDPVHQISATLESSSSS